MSPFTPTPPANTKQLLPPDVEARLRELLTGGATRDEAAALVGITRRRLDTRLNDQLRDLRVGQGRQGSRRRRQGGMEAEPDPTPAEIEWRAYLLRQTWGPERWLPATGEDADLTRGEAMRDPET